jgi:hypothetical protein
MSVVVSTIILSATLMVVVLTATGYANALLRGEIENSEFSQAKDVLSSVDRLIEKVTSTSGSSGYIRSGFVTTYPIVENTGKSLNLYAGGIPLTQVDTTVVKIRGSRDVTGTFRNISGSSTPLVFGVSTPLGWLYSNRSDAEDTILDYSRARCVYKGIVQLYNGTGYQNFNQIELTIVKLNRGSVSFASTGAFVVNNNDFETTQHKYSEDFSISAEFGGLTQNTSLSQLGGNANYATLLNLFVISVTVSVVQG